MAMARTLKNALQKIAEHGHHGATAKEIMPKDAPLALAIAADLVRRKLVLVNNANRFVLARYKQEIRPEPFVTDDDKRALRNREADPRTVATAASGSKACTGQHHRPADHQAATGRGHRGA